MAVSPAASPSSSDAQLIAGVIRRHRGLAVGTLATLLLLLGAWLALKPGASRPESGAGAGLSIVDLKVEQLTTSGTAASPAISPDGKYVAYVEQGRGGDRLRVRQVATGSNIEIVAEEPRVRLAGAPTVTPDGTFVSYVKRQPLRPEELWQVPFLGGAPRQLLVGVNSAVGYSPDGRQMAFVRDGGAGQSEVVIAAAAAARECWPRAGCRNGSGPC